MSINALRAGAAALVMAFSAPATAQTGGAAAKVDPVVATVDGQAIKLSDVVTAVRELPEEYRDRPAEALFASMLDQIIIATLLANEAGRLKLADDPAVRARIDEARDQILSNAYLERRVGAAVTEAALRARFASTTAPAGSNDEVRARHILVRTEAEAKAILGRLRGGADFAKLARTSSIGPSRTGGGDLGFFTRAKMVPAFAEAAFALKEGEVSQPVKTQFGWHVIKVEARRQGRQPRFEDAAEALRAEMSGEVVSAVIAELRGKANIVRFNADGSAPPPMSPIRPAAP